jgi:hypothetical protein
MSDDGWENSITATVFGGSEDPNDSAYDGHFITDTEFGCALPYHFLQNPRPQVAILNLANNRMAIVDIVDVGPWNTTDNYWMTNSRPKAETETGTNRSGIDLTPAVAKYLDIDGKGMVSWCFATNLLPGVPNVS